MAQNISNTNAFTTNYDVGVPEQTDVANIIQAFTEYHYGPDYDGTGDPEGMEGHLAGLASDITTHASASTGVHGVGAGSVVGTTSSQTLTNKTLTSPTISSPTISSPSITGTATVTADVNITGRLDVQEIRESISTNSLSSGILTVNFNSGTNVTLSSPASNFTINATNVPTDNDKVMSITVVVTQGSTARIPSAFQIDGSAQTIRWIAGITPTPTANKIDIFSFTIIRQSSAWTVLAQASLNF